MRMAVIGDSILWGQGLRPDEKISALVKKGLEQGPGAPKVQVFSYAHSGADVWDDGETDIDIVNPIPDLIPTLTELPREQERERANVQPYGLPRAEFGEIPYNTPYSLCQVDTAAAELAGSPPDLVLLDAGINDVNVTNFVLPLKSRQALEARTRSIGNRVRLLLEHVRASFPDARIVLTGYYRVVTEHSDVREVLRFALQFLLRIPPAWRQRWHLSAHLPGLLAAVRMIEEPSLGNVNLADRELAHAAAELLGLPAPRLTLHNVVVGSLRERLVELSRVFATTCHDTLRAEVADFNQRHGGGSVLLAIPDLPPEHAMQTPTPWLFGLGPALEPQDSLAEHRREICGRVAPPPQPHQRFLWERASVGHPNSEGAKAYARAILSVLR